MSVFPGGSIRGPFWSVFERSLIPMTLVDGNRTYVAVNDAAVDLFQRPREDIVGSPAISGVGDVDPALARAAWAKFMRTGELYGEKVIRVSPGPPLRVSFVAHATKVEDQWRALFVIVSARREPDGEQLVRGVLSATGDNSASQELARGPHHPSGKKLTAREREIVERVALGRSTPQIAGDLSLSPATVRSHVRNAMVKTGSHTRAQLVALVLSDGRAG